MTGSLGVAVLLLLGTVYLLFSGMLSFVRAQRYRRAFRVERTRRYWGEARNHLMDLARNGELDVNSLTFQRLYDLHTFVLRCPEKYSEVSRNVVESFRTPDGLLTDWISELPEWPSGLATVFEKMAMGTASLVFMHLPIKKLAPLYLGLGAFLVRYLSHTLLARVLPRVEPAVNLARVRRDIERLAQRAANGDLKPA